MKKRPINFHPDAGSGGGAELTPEQIVAQIKTKQAEVDAAIASKADKSDTEALKAEIAELRKKEADARHAELEAIVKAQGEEITALKDADFLTREQAIKSIADGLVQAIKANKDAIADHVKAGKGLMEVSLKDAGTMLTTNYTGGTVGLSALEPGVARIARRNPFLRQIINTRGTSSKFVVWVEQANPDGGAGMTGEGADKNQADFDLVERSKQVRKVTAFIKVSMEMLEDIDFIEGEIRSELMELVELKLDEQILSGDDLSENLKGILEYAVPFAAPTSLAGSIVAPNNFDVLRAAVAQIALANFQANYALINPADAASMDLAKASDGHYVMPPFSTPDGQRVAGLVVIENNGVAQGDFVVMDSTKSNLRIRKDMAVMAGRDGNDFTKNLWTIICELRAVHFIKTNHVNAFVAGTFSTAIAELLETPAETP